MPGRDVDRTGGVGSVGVTVAVVGGTKGVAVAAEVTAGAASSALGGGVGLGGSGGPALHERYETIAAASTITERKPSATRT